MTDINKRGKLPITVVSSSVNTGYSAQLTASVGLNVDIVNAHKDHYGELEGSPSQGPFTEQHVGGNQHRHIALNPGTDNISNRPEGYILSASANSIKIYGPDINGTDKPRATFTRGLVAKSPINIENIETSGNIAGNFEHNYQVVQSVGRRTTNNLINDGFVASGSLTTKFVSGSSQIYSLPDITNNSKSIFVERFNAPGGKEESSRGALDREGEEFAPNNSLTTRNIKVRQPYYNQLAQHAPQFNSGSTNKLLPATGSTTAVTVHGVNRNSVGRIREENGTYVSSSRTDNFWVQHAIPSSDLRYRWISSSLSSSQQPIEYQSFGGEYDRNGAFSDINFVPSSSFGDHLGISGAVDKDHVFSSVYTNTMYRERRYLSNHYIEPVVLTGSLATSSGDRFGCSVALNSAGDRLVVGACNDESGSVDSTGLAYVFISGSGGWTESAKLSGSLATSSNDQFGYSIAMNSTGDRIVVGAPSDESGSVLSTGLVYVFVSGSGGWTESAKLSGSLATSSFDQFGDSVAMNSTGDRIVVGAPSDESGSVLSTGLVYVFVSGSGGWTESAKLSGSLAIDASDRFGVSVDLNSAGDRLVVGAFQDERSSLTSSSGLAYVFVSGTSGWTENAVLSGSLAASSSDLFGYSVSFNSTGDRLIVGAYNDEISGSVDNRGLAYVFVSSSGGWKENAILSGSFTPTAFSQFGRKVSMNAYGNIVSVSSDGDFSKTGIKSIIYIFESGSYGWNEKLIIPNIDSTGKSIFLNSQGNILSVGSPRNNSAGTSHIYQKLDNQCYIDLSNISSEISEKDFTISFWLNLSSDIYDVDILEYSGTASDNVLSFKNFSDQSQRTTRLTGNGVINTFSIDPSINDNNWHMITLVSDLSTQQLRVSSSSPIPLSSTRTKIYVDGGLVSNNKQAYKKLDISKLIFLPNLEKYTQVAHAYIDEIIVWDKTLSEQQILDCFKISKTEYGARPKKYVEHKFDSRYTSTPSPIHVYSSRVDNIQNIVFDEVGDKIGTLQQYTSSVNLKPSLNQTISYSTYFNGPYEAANWKFIRGNEHPITRKLTTENTNIISVVIPEKEKTITKTINGNPVRITIPGGRKQGTLLNVKEPPVYINNKPLKHRFIFKDSVDKTSGYEIIHTHNNNLQYFANNQLNNSLGLKNEEEQLYDKLYDFYGNEDVDENENPIEKFLGYTYSETIFPKKEDAFLKETRMRTDYITDQPGYSIDGYDRQLGIQRVFWRDSQQDRQRTENYYINSMGYQVFTGSNFASSVAALEEKLVPNYKDTIVGIYVEDDFFKVGNAVQTETAISSSGELNSFIYFGQHQVSSSYSKHYLAPVSKVPELYFSENSNVTNLRVFKNPWSYDIETQESLNLLDLRSIRAVPHYTYEHSQLMVILDEPIKYMTLDLGLSRNTEKISGKNPWYDSYEAYMADFKNANGSQNYSVLKEFKISDNIYQAISQYGGDFRKIKFTDVKDNISVNFNKKVQQQNSKLVKQDKITFKLETIKKLLPYNGFYPQDKSIQLVGDLKKSYIDTNAVEGGFLLSNTSSAPVAYYDSASNSGDLNSYSLRKYYKEASFLEPLYAPGIFYNTIKSGIAVDWGVYTGSLPYGTGNFQILSITSAPTYRAPFETILDPFNGFAEITTESTSSSRIMKSKDVSCAQSVFDIDSSLFTDLRHFQGFFELEKRTNPIYSLSISNFLAETINFFLKESKLNSIVSKPESQFKTMIAGKKYYMDVVLRNRNVVMIDSFSSSLNDNYGNMKGSYFGPSYFTGSSLEEQSILVYGELYKAQRDPGYCMYTPPYFYGKTIARISFTPTDTKQYSLEEIFGDCVIEHINTGLRKNYSSGSLYEPISMPVESSVTLFGKQIEQSVQFDPVSNIDPALKNSNNLSNLFGIASSTSNDSNNYRWVISTKMETPVLDFSEQDYIQNDTILTASQYFDNDYYFYPYPLISHPTSSGFGIGMWSGYGNIPTGSQGIFFELKESFPNRITQLRTNSVTGSLIDVCGFTAQSRRVGELADSKTISEAIVIIPYSVKKKNPKVIRKDGNTIIINGTKKIEGYNLFKVSREIFQKQRSNIEHGEPAVKQGDFGSQETIQETSISNMIKLMNKYVIPPNFNFLEYSDIDPFVMYIAEFESTLDKQDLADIWQGVMPKPAMKAELDDATLSHDNNIHNFFHGEGLPEDVKFMVFKVKRKAEINYYKMTADSTDDDRFRFDFKIGKKAPEYSFNWPYDYFSLVELAKIDIEIDYVSRDEELKQQQVGVDVRDQLQREVETRSSSRGIAGRQLRANTTNPTTRTNTDRFRRRPR